MKDEAEDASGGYWYFPPLRENRALCTLEQTCECEWRRISLLETKVMVIVVHLQGGQTDNLKR